MGYPKTSDGRHIYLPSRYRGDVDPYFAGCDDAGGLFHLCWASAPAQAEDKTKTWNFVDWVYVSKGTIQWTNAGCGDYAAFKVDAPATTLAANAGLGNCNLVKVQQLASWDNATSYVAGNLVTHNDINYACIADNTNQAPPNAAYWINTLNAIVPAAGDGSHDYSSPVPVPAFTEGAPTGNWSWDEPDTGMGTMSWVGDGKQTYNLYDFVAPLVRWIHKLPLLGDGMLPLHPETKARKVLPQWEFTVTVHNESKNTVQFGWHLDIARKKTT